MVPADLSGDVAVRLFENKPVDADQIAYSIIASVRYRGSGKTVFVTTSKASPKVAMQQTSLGNKTMQLDNGTLAWQTVGILGAVSNQIVFTKGDLIVTIAGNVAPDELWILEIGDSLQTSGAPQTYSPQFTPAAKFHARRSGRSIRVFDGVSCAAFAECFAPTTTY